MCHCHFSCFISVCPPPLSPKSHHRSESDVHLQWQKVVSRSSDCLSVVLTTTTIYYCSQWWPLPQLLSFSAADVPTLLICLIRGVLCRRCCCLALMCPLPFSHSASHSFIQSFIHSVLCLNLSPIGAPLSSVNGSRSATAAVVVAPLSPLFLSDCNN